MNFDIWYHQTLNLNSVYSLLVFSESDGALLCLLLRCLLCLIWVYEDDVLLGGTVI